MRKTLVALSAQLINLDGRASSEVRLLPAGTFKAKDGRPANLPGWRMNKRNAETVIAAAAASVDDLVIDYNHQTLYTRENGQPAPAAAWFKNLEWREGDGLYALGVQWTEAAQAAIAAKEFRYLSPVIEFDKSSGDVVGITMAALVNYAALDGLSDLAAAHFNFNHSHSDEIPMNKELLALLGLSDDADEAAVLAAVTSLKDQSKQTAAALAAQVPNAAEYVPVSAFVELQTQFAALSAKVGESEIDKLIQANLSKLPTPGIQAWAKGLSIEALSAYLANAPEIAALSGTQTHGKAPDDAAPTLTLEEQSVANQMGISTEQMLKNKGAA